MMRIIEYLLYAFIFLLPWNARVMLSSGTLNGGYWEYGSVSLYATDIVFLMVLVLSVIWGWRNNQISKSEILNPKQTQNSKLKTQKYILGSLLLFLFLSILWSSHPGVAAYATLRLVQGIILFALVRTLPLNRTRLVYALVAGAVVQALLAIVQFSMQEVVAWPWSGMAAQLPSTPGVAVVEAAGRRWLRAYGSFPHPNLLGAYFAMTLLILLEVFQSPITKIQTNSKFITHNSKFLFALSSTLLTIGLFLTFSRAAWLALIIGVVIWIIQHRAWKSRAVQVGGAAIGVIVILYSALFWPLISSRVTGIGRLELKSTSERIQYIRESFSLIRNHAFLGVGIGNYTAAVHNELRPNDPSWSYQPVHNVYLLVFAELGIVSIVLFVLFFRQLVIHNSKFITLNSALIILLLFDHSFWTLHSGILLFWLSIALQKDQENKALDVI